MSRSEFPEKKRSEFPESTQVKAYKGSLGHDRAINDIRKALNSDATYTCGLIVSTALDLTAEFEQKLARLRYETGKQVGLLIGKDLAYFLIRNGLLEL